MNRHKVYEKQTDDKPLKVGQKLFYKNSSTYTGVIVQIAGSWAEVLRDSGRSQWLSTYSVRNDLRFDNGYT